MAQTGASEAERRDFLNAFHKETRAALINEWEPTEALEPLL